jgi:hypothetical protein
MGKLFFFCHTENTTHIDYLSETWAIYTFKTPNLRGGPVVSLRSERVKAH